MEIDKFIGSITNKVYNQIRESSSDAEARRYLKEHLTNQLILSGVSNRRELCDGKCGMSYCDDNGCLNKKEILGEPKDTSIVE
tara:strand:- start:193 stop:441 length:249 start_codon:yes stop_codon:yes gene_type:complete